MKFTLIVLALCLVAAMASITAPGNSAHYVTWAAAAEEVEISKPSKFCVRFTAQGSNDAHILLSTQSGVERISEAYEIVLGGWGNTKSVIRVGTQGTVRDTFPLNPNVHGNVMNAKEARPFWISFVDGELSVGRGRACYDDTIMTTTLLTSGPHKSKFYYSNIRHVAFGAWDTPIEFDNIDMGDAESNWMQFNVPGNGRMYKVFNYPNQIRLDSVAFELVFKARGDAATIGLLDKYTLASEDAIEFVIDAKNNTETQIWKGTQGSGKAKLIAHFPTDMKKHPTGFVDYYEYRPFWIRKYGRAVAIGRGLKVGQQTMAIGRLPDLESDTVLVGWTAKDYPSSYIMVRSENVTKLGLEEERKNLYDYFDAMTEAKMETTMIKSGQGFNSKLYEEWQSERGEKNLDGDDLDSWVELQYKLADQGNPTAIGIIRGTLPKPTPPKETAAEWETSEY